MTTLAEDSRGKRTLGILERGGVASRRLALEGWAHTPVAKDPRQHIIPRLTSEEE